MIAIGITIQCSSIPRMCCQISTESPNDAPSDNTTVPTITTAAIRLLVNSTMIMKIRHSEAIPAINMSYFEPSARSLNVAAVPPREMPGVLERCPLDGFDRSLLDRVDEREPFRGCRVIAVRNDHPHRLAVRRQEHLHAALEVWIVEYLGRQVERIVVVDVRECAGSAPDLVEHALGIGDMAVVGHAACVRRRFMGSEHASQPGHGESADRQYRNQDQGYPRPSQNDENLRVPFLGSLSSAG